MAANNHSGRSILYLLLFAILVVFVPPFNLLLMPVFMMFEPSPETVAKRGQPIVQAISDVLHARILRGHLDSQAIAVHANSFRDNGGKQ